MISIVRPEGDEVIDALQPYERLALGILVQAVKDARYMPPQITLSNIAEVQKKLNIREQAREWLADRPCSFLCQALDIDYVIVETWAYAGYPKPKRAFSMAGDFGLTTYQRSAEESRRRNGKH